MRVAALSAALRQNILDFDVLIEALGDPAMPVRRRALTLTPRWAASRGGPAPRQALSTAVLLLLSDDACAELAAFVLGELEATDPDVIAGLEHQVRHHDDPLCREAAVAALGALGVGLDTVLTATGDIATVRRRAVIALANFEGPDVEEALTRALEDRDWQVRQAAEDLLEPPSEDRG